MVKRSFRTNPDLVSNAVDVLRARDGVWGGRVTYDGDPRPPWGGVLMEGQRLETGPTSAIPAELFLFLCLVVKYFLGKGKFVMVSYKTLRLKG